MDYKSKILELLELIEDNDIIFLKQLYTIIKKHIEKRKVGNHFSFKQNIE
ncbi:hypothetical protein C819_02267 [Lachnospiraceae bacterium 10-1]|nr:hypothetical protein C819_02267 [Lachnospiraceae bacterium 10-1]